MIAGDISPIDVITHVPMLCEEAGVQYVYVHSKEQLGAAGMTKRPTSVMLVLPKAVKGSVKMGKDDEKEFEEMYKSVHSKVKGMREVSKPRLCSAHAASLKARDSSRLKQRYVY